MHGHMPVISFCSGSLFTFHQEVFRIGQQPDDLTDLPFEGSRYSFVPYYFKAIFDRPSQYLAIPFKVIRTIAAGLNISTNIGNFDVSNLLQLSFHGTVDLNTHLEMSTEIISKRIRYLLPWLNGDLRFFMVLFYSF